MHYDSENEGKGVLRHPIVSTVLCLSEGESRFPIAIRYFKFTNGQALWLLIIINKTIYICMYIHHAHWDMYIEHKHPGLSPTGVGGPTIITNQRAGCSLADKGWLVHPKLNRLTTFNASYLHGVLPGRLHPDLKAKGEENKRITFMVGFWDWITPRSFDGRPGASQAFPTEESGYTVREGWKGVRFFDFYLFFLFCFPRSNV